MMTDKGYDLIRQAQNHVSEMYNGAGMISDDYKLFETESPKIMATIREIEDKITGETSDEETMVLMDRWVKNWKLLIDRRALAKVKPSFIPPRPVASNSILDHVF